MATLLTYLIDIKLVFLNAAKLKIMCVIQVINSTTY